MKNEIKRYGALALVVSGCLTSVACSSSGGPNTDHPVVAGGGAGGAPPASGGSVSAGGQPNPTGGSAQGGATGAQAGTSAGAGASSGGAAGAGGAAAAGAGANAGGGAGLDPGTGPLKELTLDTAKQLYFEHLAAGYKFVEAKGVNSGLPGRYSRWVKGQDPEFITRNMEAMGAWLSQPARPTMVTTSRGTLDVEEMMRKALANGTDPASGVTWQTLDMGQLDVESGSISWGTFLAGARVLSKLTPAQSTNLQTWLYNHTASVADQNWNMFYIVTNSFLKNQGWKFTAGPLATDLGKIESYYKGDGWYTDGATHVFDEYNNTVFVPDTIAWSVMTGSDNPTQRTAMMMRVRRFLQDQPYFFGTNGMHPEFGRSTAYKTARLTGLLIAYYIDRTYNTPDKWNLGFKVLPETFTLGMLRRLVREQLNYYFTNALDPATGLLVQAATLAGSVDIAEDYISPGSVSWAVRAFGPLFLLADDDPFWSTPEEALPIEKASYNQWLPTPGLLLSGTQSTGNVVLFNAGSTFSTAHTDSYILKYGKFAYSSQLGFAVANDSTTWRNPDNAIQIGVGTAWGHREEPGIFASQSNAPDAAVLSMKHRQTVAGDNFDVRTIIFVKDEFHVRVNKVTPVGFSGTYLLREGGFAIGRSAANSGTAMQDAAKTWSYDTGAEGAGMVAALKTYNDVQTDLPAAEKREGAATPGMFNTGTAHTRYQYYALPYVQTSAAQTGEQTVALLVRGSKVPFDPAATFATVKSLVVDATTATITFADGSSLVGTFLN